jgi:hypothetical protein
MFVLYPVLFCFNLNLISRQTTCTNSRSHLLPLSSSPQRKVCAFAPCDQLVNTSLCDRHCCRRLGFDSFISRKPVFRIHLSDDRFEYRFFCIFHSIPGAQQRGILVRYFLSAMVSAHAPPSQKWGIPRLTMTTYLQFCSLLCFGVTFWLVLFEKEVCMGLQTALYWVFNPIAGGRVAR